MRSLVTATILLLAGTTTGLAQEALEIDGQTYGCLQKTVMETLNEYRAAVAGAPEGSLERRLMTSTIQTMMDAHVKFKACRILSSGTEVRVIETGKGIARVQEVSPNDSEPVWILKVHLKM